MYNPYIAAISHLRPRDGRNQAHITSHSIVRTGGRGGGIPIPTRTKETHMASTRSSPSVVSPPFSFSITPSSNPPTPSRSRCCTVHPLVNPRVCIEARTASVIPDVGKAHNAHHTTPATYTAKNRLLGVCRCGFDSCRRIHTAIHRSAQHRRARQVGRQAAMTPWTNRRLSVVYVVSYFLPQ